MTKVLWHKVFVSELNEAKVTDEKLKKNAEIALPALDNDINVNGYNVYVTIRNNK